MEELVTSIREAVDRKQENVRRRKRKDALRLHLVRVFELIAQYGTFGIRYYSLFILFLVLRKYRFLHVLDVIFSALVFWRETHNRYTQLL